MTAKYKLELQETIETWQDKEWMTQKQLETLFDCSERTTREARRSGAVRVHQFTNKLNRKDFEDWFNNQGIIITITM